MPDYTLHSVQRAGIPRARARFLTQSMQLEERDVTGVVSAGMLLTATLVFGALIWAHLTPVAEVAHTHGEIIPSGRIHQVQHLEGGIVNTIYVNNGDRVHAGDVLVELRTNAVSSELAQVEARRQSLDARLWRINALLDGKTDVALQDWARLPALQQQLFQQQQETYREQLSLIEAKQRRQEHEMAAKLRQAAALTKEVSLLKERQEIHGSATNLAVIPRVTMLDVSARLARAVGQLREVQAEIVVARGGILEAEQQKTEFISRWRQDLRLEAEQIAAQIAETREEANRLEDKLHRLNITAPETGVVQGLRVNTLNAVIGPGQVILDLVPVDDELIAETKVLPRDIGHVHAGQRVNVKVSSYEAQRFGTIPGSLRSVSATTNLDEDNQPYFKAEILLAQNYVGDRSDTNLLLPGMTVEADIRTGEKTVLEYVLKPVYRGFSGSMRER